MAYSIAGGCNAMLQVYGFGIVLLLGSFATNAAVSPVAANNKGKGFSVAWTATGTWTLTFNSSALSVLSAWVVGQNAANVDISLQFGAIDVVTALTAVIRNNPSGVLADLTANASNRVHFGFYMATSGINY